MQKKKGATDQMGGLLPISSFVSRHYSGVVTGGRGAHGRRFYVHGREPTRTRACQGRAVATNLLGLFVATELVHPVSLQGFGQLGLLCRDMTFCAATSTFHCGTDVCRNRVFSVATGLVVWCRDSAFWCRDSAF